MPPDPVDPVRLLVSCLYAPQADLSPTREQLVARFGPIAAVSQNWAFDVTDYYEAEMGSGLRRLFWSFERLIAPDRLPAIKLLCAQLEATESGKRQVNLDPMYLDHHKLLMASFKAAGQKVYLGQGVWGDLALRFHQGGWSSLDWSFPDFADGRFDAFLSDVRGRYLTARREAAAVPQRPSLETVADALPMESAPARDQLGRYHVTGQLGAGGMGEVLQVHDAVLGRDVAAKLILGQADERTRQKFLLEAQLTGQLEHPNIVPVHELSETADGRLYFTMKRVQGRDLATVLEEGEMGLLQLLGIFLKVCDAMAFAHDRGVIHRDLKPANIMVGQFGEVQLMDWGLAKEMRSAECRGASAALPEDPLETLDGTVMGTPAYMSPEQARGEIDALDRRTDIYALGAILYEILALRPPFQGEQPWAVLAQVIEGQPVSPSRAAPLKKIPWDLEAVVIQAMARLAEQRYDTVALLRADVARFLEGLPLHAASYTPWQRAAKFVSRNKAACVAAALVLVSMLAGTGWSLIERNRAVVAYRGKQAEHQRAERQKRAAQNAEQQAKISAQTEKSARLLAEARQGLAAATEALLRKDPGAAMLLAARSLERSPSDSAMRVYNEASSQLNWRLGAILIAHRDTVFDARFSPDGRRVVTSSGDRTLRICDARSGRVLQRLHHASVYLMKAQFSPDGARVLTTGDDGWIRIFGASSGKLLREIGKGLVLKALAARFSPDGKRVVAACADRIARVWHANSGRLLARMQGHQGELTSVRFSPDGRSVLTASEDGLAALFPSGSTGPPKELVFSSDPPQRVTMASFSGDGRWLLTVVGKQVQLRSVQDRTRATWIKLSKRIRAARFSPDAKYVLIQGEGKLGLWRASGTFVAWLEGHGDRVQSAVFSRDSQRVLTASADGTARVWTLTGETLAVLRGHGAALMSARFSPDRTRIVTAAQDRTARIWVRHRAKLHRRLSGVISRRPWSADGRWFAIGGEAGPRLLDGRTWKLLRRLKGHNGRAVCGAFRPDGRQLLTCGKDGKLGIWDPASGNRLAMLDHHAPVWSATFSPDGRLILSGASKEVWVWRWTTLERSVLLEEEMGGAAVFSPDSRSLVSDSGALYGIEKRIWRKRHQLGPEISYRRRSRFSPDGQLIAQAGENERVSLYSVESGKRVGQLRGHTRRVREAVFSPDGQRIASASEDLSIRIWDRATRTQIHRLRGHTAGVDQLIFSRDGRWLVSVGLDRTVRLWDVARGVQLDLFEQTHLVLGVAFSPGGRLLAVQSMGDRVTIWDLRRTRLSARMAMRRARYLTGRVLDGWAVEPEPILLIPERIRTALYAATPPRPSDSGYFGWLTVYRKAAQQQRPNHSRRLLTERFEQSPDPLLQLFLTLVRGSWSLAGSRNRGRRTTEYKQLVRRYEAARKVVPNHPLVKQVSRLIKSNR